MHTPREVRMALPEADAVPLPVVRRLTAASKRAPLAAKGINPPDLGQESLSVKNRPANRAGGGDGRREPDRSTRPAQPPAVVLMAGLQGAGKTTSVGVGEIPAREKLMKKVLVVSADVYRPAAIKQLKPCRAGRRRFLPSASV